MATHPDTIVMGSRGSRLAAAQYEEVKRRIESANPNIVVEHKTISTRGDENRDRSVASLGVGVFVSEVETALLRGEIDVAVHSLKDLPTKLSDDLTIAGVPYREDARDVVVSNSGLNIEELPTGSIVATGSARRRALVHSMRNDLIMKPIRGNVTTRLDMLEDPSSNVDALILAAAGLKRLGMADVVTHYLSCMSFTSAPGQGALALQVRASDEVAASICKSIEHEPTRRCVDAERAFLRAIGGGCTAPIGAHARIDDETMTMSAFVADPSGSKVLRCSRSGPSDAGEALAHSIASELSGNGARKLLADRTTN